MNSQEIDEQQLIERYILNQMSEDEMTKFESYYLANQACLEQLELAEKLYEGIQANASLLAQEIPSTRDSKAANQRHWWQQKIPAWSLAAAILIAIIPNQYMQIANNDSHQIAELNVIGLSLADTRSINEIIDINITKNQQVILSTYIDTELDAFTYPTYRLELISSATLSTAWSSPHLKRDNNDMLFINLGTNNFKSGRYKFSLIGINKEGGESTLKAGVISLNIL
ncbi:hypothetical protein [Thalassotalea montiporae]